MVRMFQAGLLGLFVNGIPVSILELKNSLTGQTHIDGEKQFRDDRDPKAVSYTHLTLPTILLV